MMLIMVKYSDMYVHVYYFLSSSRSLIQGFALSYIPNPLKSLDFERGPCQVTKLQTESGAKA